jgi:hypothetical protein
VYRTDAASDLETAFAAAQSNLSSGTSDTDAALETHDGHRRGRASAGETELATTAATAEEPADYSDENVSITMFNEIKEATIDTPLPRVILLMPIPCFTPYQGTILASGISEMTIDGVKYTLETSEHGLDANDNVVPYDPNAGYTIFGVGTWWENGEKVILSFAAKE